MGTQRKDDRKVNVIEDLPSMWMYEQRIERPTKVFLKGQEEEG
jgi:hypothetical protein